MSVSVVLANYHLLMPAKCRLDTIFSNQSCRIVYLFALISCASLTTVAQSQNVGSSSELPSMSQSDAATSDNKFPNHTPFQNPSGPPESPIIGSNATSDGDKIEQATATLDSKLFFSHNDSRDLATHAKLVDQPRRQQQAPQLISSPNASLGSSTKRTNQVENTTSLTILEDDYLQTPIALNNSDMTTPVSSTRFKFIDESGQETKPDLESRTPIYSTTSQTSESISSSQSELQSTLDTTTSPTPFGGARAELNRSRVVSRDTRTGLAKPSQIDKMQSLASESDGIELPQNHQQESYPKVLESIRQSLDAEDSLRIRDAVEEINLKLANDTYQTPFGSNQKHQDENNQSDRASSVASSETSDMLADLYNVINYYKENNNSTVNDDDTRNSGQSYVSPSTPVAYGDDLQQDNLLQPDLVNVQKIGYSFKTGSMPSRELHGQANKSADIYDEMRLGSSLAATIKNNNQGNNRKKNAELDGVATTTKPLEDPDKTSPKKIPAPVEPGRESNLKASHIPPYTFNQYPQWILKNYLINRAMPEEHGLQSLSTKLKNQNSLYDRLRQTDNLANEKSPKVKGRQSDQQPIGKIQYYLANDALGSTPDHQSVRLFEASGSASRDRLASNHFKKVDGFVNISGGLSEVKKQDTKGCNNGHNDDCQLDASKADTKLSKPDSNAQQVSVKGRRENSQRPLMKQPVMSEQDQIESFNKQINERNKPNKSPSKVTMQLQTDQLVKLSTNISKNLPQQVGKRDKISAPQIIRVQSADETTFDELPQPVTVGEQARYQGNPFRLISPKPVDITQMNSYPGSQSIDIRPKHHPGNELDDNSVALANQDYSMASVAPFNVDALNEELKKKLILKTIEAAAQNRNLPVVIYNNMKQIGFNPNSISRARLYAELLSSMNTADSQPAKQPHVSVSQIRSPAVDMALAPLYSPTSASLPESSNLQQTYASSMAQPTSIQDQLAQQLASDHDDIPQGTTLAGLSNGSTQLPSQGSRTNLNQQMKLVGPEQFYRWALNRMPDLVPIPLAATVPGYLIRLPNGQILAAALTDSLSIQGIHKDTLKPAYKNYLSKRFRNLLKSYQTTQQAAAGGGGQKLPDESTSNGVLSKGLINHLEGDSSVSPIIVQAPQSQYQQLLQLHNEQQQRQQQQSQQLSSSNDDKSSNTGTGFFVRNILKLKRPSKELSNEITLSDSQRVRKSVANRDKLKGDNSKQLNKLTGSASTLTDLELASLPLAEPNEPVFSFADESQLLDSISDYPDLGMLSRISHLSPFAYDHHITRSSPAASLSDMMDTSGEPTRSTSELQSADNNDDEDSQQPQVLMPRLSKFATKLAKLLWGRTFLVDDLIRRKRKREIQVPPPGGFEPPTFWLTAKRASRLRHGGLCLCDKGQK